MSASPLHRSCYQGRYLLVLPAVRMVKCSSPWREGMHKVNAWVRSHIQILGSDLLWLWRLCAEHCQMGWCDGGRPHSMCL
jgi:hypothetical protein